MVRTLEGAHAPAALVTLLLLAVTPAGESMCRLCDELACPDPRCPVERAEPAPAVRCGLGYGVGVAPSP